MKKVDLIKIIGSSLVAILIIAVVILKGISGTNIVNDSIKNLNNDIKNIYDYINKFNIPEYGTVSISAKYKGAHGESFPKDFKFDYKVENNELYFSNKSGYNTLDLPIEVLNLYRLFKSEPKDIFVEKNSTKNGTSIIVTLDEKNINKYLNKEIKKAELTINKESIASNKIKDMTLSLDDYIINIDNKKYKIMHDKDIIDLTIVKSGYSMAINNNIKLNVIINDDIDNYNIIVDNFVYSLNVSDNKIKFTCSTSASIYNSIEAIFNGKDDININKDKKLDIKDNPLTRYFNEMR